MGMLSFLFSLRVPAVVQMIYPASNQWAYSILCPTNYHVGVEPTIIAIAAHWAQCGFRGARGQWRHETIILRWAGWELTPCYSSCRHPALKSQRESLLCKACTILPTCNNLNDTDKLVFLLSTCDMICFSAKTCCTMLNIRTDVSGTDFM